MALGLDLFDHPAEPLTRSYAKPPDLAVTMDAGDTCIIDPTGAHLAWQTDDLTGTTVDQARRIRDEIDLDVQLLMTRILLDSP